MLEKGLPDERGSPFLLNILYLIGYKPIKCILYCTFSGTFCNKVRVKPDEICNKIRVKPY